MEALLFIPWFKLEPIPLGPIPIQPFGILVACGVLLGMKVAELWSKKNGVSPAATSDLVAHVTIIGFLGAYLLNTAFYEPEKIGVLFTNPKEFFTEYLGLSSYGGFIGALLGCVVWKKRRNLHLLPVADAASFAFPFGWFFGRMGCFVVHDHPGEITDFPLAVEGYRFGQPPYEPRHDLGLYEVFWSAAVVALFLVLGRQKRPWGFYMALLPILYAPVRFFLDYLRADPSEGGDAQYFGFTPGQYGSIAILIAGVVLMYFVNREAPHALPRDMRYPPPLDKEKGEKGEKSEGAPKKAAAKE